jgi:hypothetical protein
MWVKFKHTWMRVHPYYVISAKRMAYGQFDSNYGKHIKNEFVRITKKCDICDKIKQIEIGGSFTEKEIKEML